jgi:hypothetical protein
MKSSKRKIIIYFCTLALLIASVIKADAQKVEFGLRFMPTITSFDMKTSSGGTVKGEVTFGYGVGALLGFNFNDHVGIQGELMYSSISQKYKEQDVEQKINLKYVNIPLLLSLNTGKSKPVNLNIVAGPQIGISAGSSVSSTGGEGTSTVNAQLSVKKGDLGFAYGAGLDFGLNASRTARLGIGFRGVFGLIDISDNSNSVATDSYYILDRTHIQTYSGYIGISFLF